jgi:hypothetical protein
MAAFDWIMFNDSDDFWVENKIEIQMNELARLDYDPRVALYSGMSIKEPGKELRYASFVILDGASPLREILIGRSFLFQSLLVSKKALEEIGCLDEAVASYQEWETSIRLADVCRFVYIDKPLFIWNRHEGETISGNISKSQAGYKYILDKHKNIFINTGRHIWLRHVFVVALGYSTHNQREDAMNFLAYASRQLKSVYLSALIFLDEHHVSSRAMSFILRCFIRLNNCKFKREALMRCFRTRNIEDKTRELL